MFGKPRQIETECALNKAALKILLRRERLNEREGSFMTPISYPVNARWGYTR
jgi:hypothetical protein